MITKSLRCGLVLGLFLAGASSTFAANRVKANNASNLNTTASWAAATVPGVSDVAVWTNTVTAANDVLLGGDLNFGGLAVFNPGGAVSVSGAESLSLGVFGIDMTRATRALTLAPGGLVLATNASVLLSVTNGGTLTLNPTNFTRGSGASLALTNSGTVATATLTNDTTGLLGTWARYGLGTNTSYATISGGAITAYVGVAAPTAGDVVDTGGTTNYDVAAAGALGPGASFNTLRHTGAAGGIGGNFSANGLMNAGGGALSFSNDVTIGANRELVLTSPDSTRSITLSGVVGDHGSGTSGVTIAGGGRVVLAAGNTYGGVTVVGAGTLAITNASALGTTNGNTVVYSTGSIGLNGGQLSLSGNVTVPESILVQGPGDGTFGAFNGAVASAAGTNTVSGTITLSGGTSYRLGAPAAGAVLNLGLIQRATASGGAVIIDPVGGATVNVNVPMDNNLGSLTCHAGGLVVLNASGNDIGQATAQNSTTLRITATDALGVNQTLQIGQSVGANGASGVNNDVGTFILDAPSQTINALVGSTNSGANATTSDKRKITTTTSNTVTLIVGNGNGGSTFDGVIENGTNGGTLVFTKVGTGAQTLAGSRANTYTGLTTVSTGTLNLAKLAGTNAVGGNILIVAGTLVHQRSDQIPDGSSVTMTTTNAKWDMGGFNETVTNLDMQNANPATNGGYLTGQAGKLTVLGTLTHTLGNITINSGGTNQSWIDANALVNLGGSWTFGVSSGTQSLHVGSGGLTMGGGSTLFVDATVAFPNFVTLDGNVTSLAHASNNIISGAGQIRLGGTRVFTIADGAAASDLLISAILADTTNGPGSLVKEGPGTLTLSGANLYTGTTTINGGVLAITATNSLPGWDTTGRFAVASGGALAVANTIGDGFISTLLGTGNFGAGGSLGFDTSAGNRTYASNIADTVGGSLGLVKLGTNALTLSGTNTWTGTTTIGAGVLVIATTDALPGWDTNGRYSVASNAALAVANGVASTNVVTMLGTTNFAAGASIGFDTSAGGRTFTNVISNSVNGTLGVVKVGTNTLTLSASNTYDGVTTITRGSLQVNHPSALGTTNGATIINCNGGVTSGGQLVLAGGITLTEPIVFAGAGDGAPFVQSLQVAGGGGSNALAGPISLLTVGSARMTGGGAGTVLSINTPIVRTNNSSGLILGANGSGGLVIVNQPMLLNGGALTLHNGPGTILLNSAGNNIGDTAVQYIHLLKLGVSDALATNRNLLIGANPNNGDPNAERGTFDLAGFNQTINGLYGNGTNAAAHPATRLITNSAAGQSTLTIGNGNATNSFNGLIAGNVALTKIGTGVQTLSGTNTFTGVTTILGGTLALTGNCALASTSILVGAGANLSVTGRLDGALTLAAGQQLGGHGTVLGSVFTEGTVSPGASAGMLTVAGDVLQSSGLLAIELGGTNAGVGYDQLVVSNTFFAAGSLEVTLINGFTPAWGQSFTLVSATTVAGSFGTVNTPVLATPGLGWKVDFLATSVVLSVTGTPSSVGFDLYAQQITNAADRGYAGDPDGDGYVNLLEYVTGGNPTNADAAARLQATRTGGVLALQFTRATNAIDATLIVEGSYGVTNGVEWTGIATNVAGSWGGATNVTETLGSPASVTAFDVVPAATNRFLRLRVSRP